MSSSILRTMHLANCWVYKYRDGCGGPLRVCTSLSSPPPPSTQSWDRMDDDRRGFPVNLWRTPHLPRRQRLPHSQQCPHLHWSRPGQRAAASSRCSPAGSTWPATVSIVTVHKLPTLASRAACLQSQVTAGRSGGGPGNELEVGAGKEASGQTQSTCD